jgi:hypothetical protein
MRKFWLQEYQEDHQITEVSDIQIRFAKKKIFGDFSQKKSKKNFFSIKSKLKNVSATFCVEFDAHHFGTKIRSFG